MRADDELTGKALRVLLIEDNLNDAFMVERHLRRAGFAVCLTRVETAEHMSTELENPNHEEGWDVILADYNLPFFSAPAALRVLKASGRDLPFIVMSGAVSEETAVSAMRAGAHDYISKQNLARLAPAIEREVSEARIRRERGNAGHALRASEQRFHRLVEAMPLGLLLSGYKGDLFYANGAVEYLLGFSPWEIRDCPVTLQSILPDSAEFLLSLMAGSAEEVKSRQIAPFEAECITRDGVSVSQLVATSVLNPQAPLFERQLAVFLVDLAEQKRSQEVVRRTEKLAATGRLAASIAHEINNPLEAVTNCLYLLNQTNLDERGKGYLRTAQSELDRVIHITTQTLRFYRQNTRPVETDIHELLETVIALYDARMRNFGIEVLRDFREIPRITVYDGEIRQIFANLVGNAVDAMQISGGKLRLRTARGHDWRQMREGIVVTVADSGDGMDRETVARIFEPFFSTKGATGTGLGLWVSREILAKHMGKILVRSRQATEKGEEQGWTVFRVFLPSSRHPEQQCSGKPVS